MPQVKFSARGPRAATQTQTSPRFGSGSGRESKLYASVCLDRLSRVPYLSNPASVNGVVRGARKLLQPLSQPDSGHQHHIHLTDNDNGDYSCSKSLHNEMALTLT